MEKHISTEAAPIEIADPGSSIDNRLSELYGEAVGAATAEAIPVVRTTLSNLVVYCSDSREADVAASDAAAVVGMHPCRAIIVSPAVESAEGPRATVSLVCGITPRADRRLCGEVIRLDVPSYVDVVTGSILPILAPDVPVFVWVRHGDVSHSTRIKALLAIADHAIIDSTALSEQSFPSAHDICEGSLGQCVVHDLRWESLTPWRELVARHFDSLEARRYLQDLSQIEIDYIPDATRPGPTTPGPIREAVLLCGWIGSIAELHLESGLDDDGTWVIQAAARGQRVAIRLQPAVDTPGFANIARITLRCEHGADNASFTSQMISETDAAIFQECTTVCLPRQVVNVQPRSTQKLVGLVLESGTPDQAYAAAAAVLQDNPDILSREQVQ